MYIAIVMCILIDIFYLLLCVKYIYVALICIYLLLVVTNIFICDVLIYFIILVAIVIVYILINIHTNIYTV